MKHVVTSPVLLAVLLLACLAGGARASGSDGLVVSQVYGGGGNSGATYQNDFVELLNTGAAAVDLGGYTVQYATAAGTSWQTVALAGSIAPGRYYLVQLASGGTAGAALPAPDATGTVNLASTGGKIALVHGTAALSCGATAGSCSADAAVDDLVGYGAASDYEGAGPAPALDSTHAAVRASAGCADTGSNTADFTAAAPAPRNTSDPAAACHGTTPGAPTSTATVSADVQATLSISLDQPALAFGAVAAGSTPPRLPEHVTVVSTGATGYALSVHRSAFTPADLPLGLAATAPAGATLGGQLQAGALAGIPIAPATDLLVGSKTAATAPAGDVWSTALGFTSPLPALPTGHYQTTVVFTVVAQ
jgi:hypothetical protein